MQSLGPAAGTRPIPISPVFCCSIIFLSRPHAACGAIAGMPHAACMRSSRRKADMYDNMSEQGGGGGPPSRGLTLSLPPPSASYVRPFTRSTRAQPSNEMGIYALSLSGPPLPSTLYSALRPFGSHSLPHSLTIPNWLSFSTTQAMVTVEPAWARTIVLFGVRKSTWPPGPPSSPEAPPRSTAAALGVATVSEMVPPSVPRERERESVKSVKGKA